MPPMCAITPPSPACRRYAPEPRRGSTCIAPRCRRRHDAGYVGLPRPAHDNPGGVAFGTRRQMEPLRGSWSSPSFNPMLREEVRRPLHGATQMEPLRGYAAFHVTIITPPRASHRAPSPHPLYMCDASFEQYFWCCYGKCVILAL